MIDRRVRPRRRALQQVSKAKQSPRPCSLVVCCCHVVYVSVYVLPGSLTLRWSVFYAEASSRVFVQELRDVLWLGSQCSGGQRIMYSYMYVMSTALSLFCDLGCRPPGGLVSLVLFLFSR